MNKLAYTQSTIAPGPREFPSYKPKEGQSALHNPFNQTLPLKFPKKHIVRHLPNHMLIQTSYFHAYSDSNVTHHQSEISPFRIAVISKASLTHSLKQRLYQEALNITFPLIKHENFQIQERSGI